MRELIISEKATKIFSELARKNPKQLAIIFKKIPEILAHPEHFKNLRAPLQHLKRVHIDKSFVLTFAVKNDSVSIEDYKHHKEAYK
ncbi:hypothetical protein GOV10_05715 [Candidatus Woesearchaeota archaeon]|nr:hypothetical protein [Candidatus Woesearchaeota archaeon]